MAIRISTADAFARLIGGLLGKSTPAKPTPTFTLDKKTPGAIATYRTDDGALVAGCLCDLAAGSMLGAALTLVPAARATECMRAGKLDEVLAENLREILNVSASMLNHPGEPHVALGEVLDVPGEIPEDVAAMVAKPAARLDVEISVPGYGKGRLSLISL